MRAFLAGHGWFDLHEARVQPPVGYDPHWSRLIDAGLAGVYLLFRPFAEPALAERLMRAIVADAVAVAGDRRDGRHRLAHGRPRCRARGAAVRGDRTAGLSAIQAGPDRPSQCADRHRGADGRGDGVVRSPWRWLAVAAGALTGLGLAIGLESVPILLLCGAAIAVRYLIDEAKGRGLRFYGIAVAISAAIAFLATVSPAHWTRSICDMFAVNSAGAVVIAGLGLALVSYCRAASPAMRFGLVGAVAAAAALYFLALEPRCIGGPYAMLDPAVKPIWFAFVRETQPLAMLFRTDPATALGIAAFPAAGVIAMAILLRDRSLRGDLGSLLAMSALAVAVAMMFLEVRALPYAIWFAMPLVAALAPRLFARLQLRSLVPRFLVAVLLTPTVISGGIITAADAAGTQPRASAEPRGLLSERELCAVRQASLRPGGGRCRLRTVPAGADQTIDPGGAVSSIGNDDRGVALDLRKSAGRGTSYPAQMAGRLRGDLRSASAGRTERNATQRKPVGASDRRRGAGLARGCAEGAGAGLHHLSCHVVKEAE